MSVFREDVCSAPRPTCQSFFDPRLPQLPQTAINTNAYGIETPPGSSSIQARSGSSETPRATRSARWNVTGGQLAGTIPRRPRFGCDSTTSASRRRKEATEHRDRAQRRLDRIDRETVRAWLDGEDVRPSPRARRTDRDTRRLARGSSRRGGDGARPEDLPTPTSGEMRRPSRYHVARYRISVSPNDSTSSFALVAPLKWSAASKALAKTRA